MCWVRCVCVCVAVYKHLCAYLLKQGLLSEILLRVRLGASSSRISEVILFGYLKTNKSVFIINKS